VVVNPRRSRLPLHPAPGEMEASHKTKNPKARWILIVLFLAAGALVLSVGMTFAPLIPRDYRVVSQVTVIVCLLALAIASYKNTRLRPHWRLPLAYSAACCALVISGYTGDWVVAWAGKTLETPGGLTALKLGEDATIVGIVIALEFVTRDNPAELFLSQGRLRLGLVIGVSSFLLLTILGLAVTAAQGVPPDLIRGLLPAYVSVALADGFMEELFFRGLFLKRIGRLVGDNWANVITAAVFSFAHVQAQFVNNLPSFLVAVFLLGLLWGWIMQRTRSLLAPSLVHAGVDMLIIADFFTAFETSLQ